MQQAYFAFVKIKKIFKLTSTHQASVLGTQSSRYMKDTKT